MTRWAPPMAGALYKSGYLKGPAYIGPVNKPTPQAATQKKHQRHTKLAKKIYAKASHLTTMRIRSKHGALKHASIQETHFSGQSNQSWGSLARMSCTELQGSCMPEPRTHDFKSVVAETRPQLGPSNQWRIRGQKCQEQFLVRA